MHNESKKVITVLFTRYHDIFATMIYLISGRGYTHASISLNEDNAFFYSFNFNGFRKEFPNKHKNRSKKSLGIKLEIPVESYALLCEKITDMENKKEQLNYSKLGVMFSVFRIPVKFKNKYFCSHFVAELLQLCDCIHLKKQASLYLPNHLPKELLGQNCLKEIIMNPI